MVADPLMRLIIIQTGVRMLQKSTFQEIADLMKVAWKIWLVIGLICPFVVLLLIINGGASNSELLSLIMIPAITGGLFPIGYSWSLIKSKNISRTGNIIFFILGALSTLLFFSIFAILFVVLISITIGVPQ